jgi:hypothetical protein
MNRFQILKGQEPPPLSEERKHHAEIVRLWKTIEDRKDLPELLRDALKHETICL